MNATNTTRPADTCTRDMNKLALKLSQTCTFWSEASYQLINKILPSERATEKEQRRFICDSGSTGQTLSSMLHSTDFSLLLYILSDLASYLVFREITKNAHISTPKFENTPLTNFHSNLPKHNKSDETALIPFCPKA